MEYSRFMLWFEKEVQKIVKELWNQHFIIKLTLSQLHFRETILFLEHLKDFSKRITIEFIGEDTPEIKKHFSVQEQEAFFIGKLRMLKNGNSLFLNISKAAQWNKPLLLPRVYMK